MSQLSSFMPNICGNSRLKSRLCGIGRSRPLSHAYIIEGRTGSGRRSIALLCAAALACSCKDESILPPCMKCPDCKKVLDRKSPDVIFVGTDGKASIGVEATRFLKEDVHVIPNDLEHKFYIIENADTMTVQAQNALLLTLEEPPSFAHFFLICENSALLLETIRSRAVTLKTEVLDTKTVCDHICLADTRAQALRTSAPDEFAELLKVADGSIGKALLLLDPKVRAKVHELRKLIKDTVEAFVLRSGASALLPLLFSFSTKRDVLNEQLSLLHSALCDLIFLKKSDNPPLGFYEDISLATDLCDRTSLSAIYSFCRAVETAIDENKRNVNVRLLITKMAVCADLI